MTTNEKTCLLDATSHILNVKFWRNPNHDPELFDLAYAATRNKIVQSAGHDGSERGFHTQEIQDAVREYGILMIRHEIYPCMQVPPGRVIPIYSREQAERIFPHKLARNDGVLIVRWRDGAHHALSLQRGSDTAYHVQRDTFYPLEDLDVVMFVEFIRP